MFCALNSVIAIYYDKAITKAIEFGEFSFNLDYRTFYILECHYYARLIDLNSKGIELGHNKTEIKKEISYISNRFSMILKMFNDKLDDLPSTKYKALYKEDVAPVWVMERGVPVLKKKNLYDVVTLFNLHLSRVVENIDQKNLTLDDEDMFFLYKNGIGDCMKFVNQTNSIYTENDEILLTSLYYNLIICLLTLILTSTVALSILVWKLNLLQVCSDKVWDLIYNFPGIKIVNKNILVKERLEGIHMTPESGDLDQSQAAKTLKKTQIKKYSLWMRMIAAITVYGLLSIGYMTIIFFMPIQTSLKLLALRNSIFQAYLDSDAILVEL